jgi:hypothetical protein
MKQSSKQRHSNAAAATCLCFAPEDWQQETSGRNRMGHSKGPPRKDISVVHPHHAKETVRASAR